MRKILIVIDMQNDFIDGALGTPEAQAIVPAVVRKIRSYPVRDVFATRDTHPVDYLSTQEGAHLPVPHCIKGTDGWQLRPEVAKLVPADHVFDKPTFGSTELARAMRQMAEHEELQLELVGLCTDICVVSNALRISVDPACCAGVTPQKHEAALETMRSCQIQGL